MANFYSNKKTCTYNNTGFTLIELLVVISIIGLLASIILVNISKTRKIARDTARKVSLVQLQKALEFYYDYYGEYPHSTSWPNSHYWVGENVEGGSLGHSGSGGYIPGLAPQFLSTLPQDPLLNYTPANCSAQIGYEYASDGKDYKIKSKCGSETQDPVPSTDPFQDPTGSYRPTTYSVYTSGAAMW